MELINHFYLFLAAYLMGSIPTSVWIGKIFYNTDVREHGSKNAGTTNTIRVLGAKAGIPVFIIDVLKGVAAVSLVFLIKNTKMDDNQLLNFQLILGFFALLGHIFPLFAGFKGGKGVATLLGIFLTVTPITSLIAFGFFVITLIISKYVSLSSITAGIVFMLSVILVFPTYPLLLKITSIGIAILLIITHRRNIQRLVRREENKFSFRKKI